MKTIKYADSLRIVQFSILAALTWTMSGCASASDLPPDSDSTPVPSDIRWVSVTETADDPGYCGYWDLGTDQEGRHFVQDERYYYSRINKTLADDPALQAAAGLTSVSNCADARSYMRAYNQYRELNPGPPVDKRAIYANAEPLSEGGKKANSTDGSDEVQKIYQGQSGSGWPEIVSYIWKDFGSGNWKAGCTAIRLSGTLFLTAAHCLTLPAEAVATIANFPLTILRHLVDERQLTGEWYESTNCDPPQSGPEQQCSYLHVDGYVDPNYQGEGDWGNDIAVIYVRHDSQYSLRSSATATQDFFDNNAAIATQTPYKGQNVVLVGWGRNAESGGYDPGWSTWELSSTNKVPIESVDPTPSAGVDGTYSSSSFYVYSTASKICAGDSGGASLSGSLVNGVVVSAVRAQQCALPSEKETIARLDYKFTFIERAVFTLQDGSSLHPCRCQVFTNGNPEADDSYYACNIGCTDPSPDDDTQW